MRKLYNNSKEKLKGKFPNAYNHLDKRKTIIKYLFAGGTATGIDLLLLYIFTDIFGIWYLQSAILAFIIAFFVSFSLQKYWTFRDGSREVYKQMSQYMLVALINLAINTFGMYTLVSKFQIWHILAQAIMCAFIAIISFLIYKFLIFNQEEQKENKNILIATGIFPPDAGGPATYVYNLEKEMHKLGYKIKIVTYSDSLEERQSDIYRIQRKQNIASRYLKYFWRVYQLSSWADIIYLHDLISVGIPCSIVKILKPRKKLIVRLGGDFLWEKAFNNSWTKEPLSSYYAKNKNIKEKIYIWIYKFVLKRIDVIIFTTEWQKDIYSRYLIKNNKKIEIIKNVFPKINEINESIAENKDILFVGRIVKVKNIGRVISAIKDLGQIKLTIIGDGPNKNNLKNLVKKLNLEERVIFKNKVPHSEVIKEISQSYLVVVPMVSDISPNTMLECIKLGKPVLVSQESGFYKDYKDKIKFFNPFDINELKEKIAYLLDENNYKNYIEKIKTIDASRAWEDAAREHDLIIKNL